MEDSKKLAGGSERKGTGVQGEGTSTVSVPFSAVLHDLIGSTLGLSLPAAPSKEEAARLRKQKQSYDLHVLLIQEDRDCTSAVAHFRAWLEGPTGLAMRLKPPATP